MSQKKKDLITKYVSIKVPNTSLAVKKKLSSLNLMMALLGRNTLLLKLPQ